jgi:hypothetical protein
MPPRDIVRVHVLQTELADVKHPVLTVLLGVGRSVPGVDLPSTEVDAFDLARSGCLLRRPRRLWGVKCSLLLFPFFLGLDAGIIKPLSIGLRRVGLGGICVSFGEHTTVRFALDFVWLFVCEACKGCGVLNMNRGVMRDFWRLSGSLCSSTVPFTAFSVSLASSLLSLLFDSEGLLLRLRRDNRLYFLVIKVKSNDQAKTL